MSSLIDSSSITSLLYGCVKTSSKHSFIE